MRVVERGKKDGGSNLQLTTSQTRSIHIQLFNIQNQSQPLQFLTYFHLFFLSILIWGR
jgi:hypothetical protein